MRNYYLVQQPPAACAQAPPPRSSGPLWTGQHRPTARGQWVCARAAACSAIGKSQSGALCASAASTGRRVSSGRPRGSVMAGADSRSGDGSRAARAAAALGGSAPMRAPNSTLHARRHNRSSVKWPRGAPSPTRALAAGLRCCWQSVSRSGRQVGGVWMACAWRVVRAVRPTGQRRHAHVILYPDYGRRGGGHRVVRRIVRSVQCACCTCEVPAVRGRRWAAKGDR